MHTDTIDGIKLLTLYKQHYLNRYRNSLECTYSCWGYFDGMDILDVEHAHSRLFIKKSNASISDMWYQTAKKIQKQRGIASEQNIAMFRCVADDGTSERAFWKEDTRKSFLAACFVQLAEPVHKKEVRDKLEKFSDKEVQILVYFIFDNADLILFLQSNSFGAITDKIKKIDMEPEVVYLHPVCGVLESTLHEMEENPDHVPRDRAGNLTVNDPVKELRINIVGNAGAFEGNLKYLLRKTHERYGIRNYDNIKFSYMTGHENYICSLRDTDIYTLLNLLVPKGVLTHRNDLFGNVLYNMETQLVMEETGMGSIEEREVEKDESPEVSWCRNYIERYSEYMDQAWKQADEGLYSYFQSMIQTLNSLVQFEKFRLSENIFCIIYPAFALFMKQFDRAYSSSASNRQKVMEAMLDFLDSVNSIVYHAIHMDQVFLMIPGCNGTSFSIPTKLSMFYLWYLDNISVILNDTNYSYRFYLTPVMESKPFTYMSDFGLSEGDRLICVKVSQRSLYMPRTFFLIITHEIAHYVGNDIRQRNERLKYIVRTLGYIVADAIIPYYIAEDPGMKFGKYLIAKKEEITSFVITKMGQRIIETVYKNKSDDRLHVSQVESTVRNLCAEILADGNGELEAMIKRMPPELDEEGVDFNQKAQNAYRFDYEVKQCDKRRIKCLGEGWCDTIIMSLFREYQEIFADAAAIALVGFSEQDYYDTFNVSEGCFVEEATMSQRDYNRRQVVAEIFWEKSDGRISMGESGTDIVYYWPYLDAVIENMYGYLKCCRKHFEDQFKKNQHLVDQICEAGRIFSQKDKMDSQIYDFIDEKATLYAKKIKEELQADISQIKTS